MRYIFSLVLGVVVSASLFWVMTQLLVNDQVPPEPPTPGHTLDIVDLEREVIKPDDRPPPPPKPKPQPKTEKITLAVLDKTQFKTDTKINLQPVSQVKGFGSGTGVNIDTPTFIGVVKPEPIQLDTKHPVQYPQRAIARNLEGVVKIENTVDANGNVIHVRIVESSNSIFNSAAKRSAIRWKYANSDSDKRVHSTTIEFKLVD